MAYTLWVPSPSGFPCHITTHHTTTPVSKVHTQHFYAGVVDSLVVELKGSKDFTKLYTGISVLGYIASVSDEIKYQAFSQLLSFLGHRYPKIRKASADQVYLVLLQNENFVTEEKMEEAIEIISETCWEGDIEEAKNQRLHLYKLAGLEMDSIVKITGKGSNKEGGKKSIVDENASYSSLVGSSGF